MDEQWWGTAGSGTAELALPAQLLSIPVGPLHHPACPDNSVPTSTGQRWTNFLLVWSLWLRLQPPLTYLGHRCRWQCYFSLYSFLLLFCGLFSEVYGFVLMWLLCANICIWGRQKRFIAFWLIQRKGEIAYIMKQEIQFQLCHFSRLHSTETQI